MAELEQMTSQSSENDSEVKIDSSGLYLVRRHRRARIGDNSPKRLSLSQEQKAYFNVLLSIEKEMNKWLDAGEQLLCYYVLDPVLFKENPSILDDFSIAYRRASGQHRFVPKILLPPSAYNYLSIAPSKYCCFEEPDKEHLISSIDSYDINNQIIAIVRKHIGEPGCCCYFVSDNKAVVALAKSYVTGTNVLSSERLYELLKKIPEYWEKKSAICTTEGAEKLDWATLLPDFDYHIHQGMTMEEYNNYGYILADAIIDDLEKWGEEDDCEPDVSENQETPVGNPQIDVCKQEQKHSKMRFDRPYLFNHILDLVSENNRQAVYSILYEGLKNKLINNFVFTGTEQQEERAKAFNYMFGKEDSLMAPKGYEAGIVWRGEMNCLKCWMSVLYDGKGVMFNTMNKIIMPENSRTPSVKWANGRKKAYERYYDTIKTEIKGMIEDILSVHQKLFPNEKDCLTNFIMNGGLDECMSFKANEAKSHARMAKTNNTEEY